MSQCLHRNPPSIPLLPWPEFLEREALQFAELLDYKRDAVPALHYFTDYYRSDGLTAGQVETVRESILALCKPPATVLSFEHGCPTAVVVRECQVIGCNNTVVDGPYCGRCAEEIEGLLAARSFEFPVWAKRLFAGIGYLIVFLLFVFDLTAILVLWPDGPR